MKNPKPLLWTVVACLIYLDMFVFAQEIRFDDISLMDIQSAKLVESKINGTNNQSNQIPAGTIIFYKTNKGLYGKLMVKKYGYSLTLQWQTFNADGSIYSQGDNLIIRGTKSCDLDSGKERIISRDFCWEQVSGMKRYLRPKNGAKFSIYQQDVYQAPISNNNFKIVFGSAESSNAGSNVDIQKMAVSELKGYENAVVFLTGWNLDFNKGDKQIKVIGIKLENIQFDKSSGEVSWDTKIDYAGKKFKDPFVWRYYYIVVAFKMGELMNGYESGASNGGKINLKNSIGPLLDGAPVAVLLPQGWKFDFQKGDHNIDKFELSFYNEFFNNDSKIINWKTKLNYSDKKSDDDYKYWFWYSAFSSPHIVKMLKTSKLNICKGGTGVKTESIFIPKGYDYAFVFLRGWNFDYIEEDHRLDEVGVKIENQIFDKNSKRLSWDTVVDYKDKKYSSQYKWECMYTILGFKRAEVGVQENNPSVDVGVSDILNQSKSLHPVLSE